MYLKIAKTNILTLSTPMFFATLLTAQLISFLQENI
jgi:hypothetical protein